MKVKLTDMEQMVQIANTEGLFVEDHREKTRLYINAFAQAGTDTQSGYYGPGAMRGHEYYDLIDVEACAREAARQAKVLLHAQPCKGGQMSVVVANGFGGLLFHEACGHSLEASVIANESSEFCGKLGNAYAEKYFDRKWYSEELYGGPFERDACRTCTDRVFQKTEL